jgi:hypothetical protein
MFRTGLSIYLALVTLAGPWLCCCTAARATTSLLRSTPASPAKPEAECPSCCRHHVTVPHQPAKESPRHDRPARQPCPCGQDSNRTAVALDTESARHLQPVPAVANPTDVPCLLVTEVVPAEAAPGLIDGAQSALPFLSTAELLRAFHLLRC